jgi:transcriptional regulator with XRE-family HTH domain
VPTIGDRIKEAREERGWTQERLAKETGISKGFLSETENNKGTGNIGADYVLRIANVLGVSLDYLMKGEVGQQERERAPVQIPRSLSDAAQQLGLSYSETLSLLDAHLAVIARRAARSLREPTPEEWKALWKAIKQVYSDGSEAKE